MRLLLDEMLSPRIATELRNAGMDVTAVSESITTRAMSDEEVLDLATRHERILVTANIKDFVPLANQRNEQGRHHNGILLVSAKAFPQDRSRIGRIVRALEVRAANELWPDAGQLEFL
jgi:uncharacterized protein with PIN domain